ncbi:MAG TPA: class I SAM-dependent methyltransferase [Candidatus Tectomicrobia bacterium]
MNQQRAQRRLWAWYLSALVYEWSYVQVAHQIDADCLEYLGERLVGAVVADCGCGPGVVTEKLLQAGAARVVAIDVNASMIERARVRLAKGVATGNVLVCHASHEAGTLAGVRQRILAGRGFDIVLFKRSLYMPRQRALLTLRQAAAALQAHGMIVVVHPERSLLRYAFAPPFGLTSYTPLHLINRAISRVLEWGGMEEYTLYTCHELLALLREAVPGAQVQRLPSQQRPYNLVALQVP